MKKDTNKDMLEVIGKLQEQIAVIDRKIDVLISKSSPRPVDPRPSQPQGNGYKERILYKAVCADCKKGCEVPFKPSGERPIYCKECFSKRKSIGSFRPGQNNRQASIPPKQEVNVVSTGVIEKKKAVSKKKIVSKKKKK